MKKSNVAMLAIICLTLCLMVWSFAIPVSADKVKDKAKSNAEKREESTRTDTASPSPDRGGQSDKSGRSHSYTVQNPKQVSQDRLESSHGSEDPDLTILGEAHVDKEELLSKRDQYFNLLRGMIPGRPFRPEWRVKAVEQMAGQQKAKFAAALKKVGGGNKPDVGPPWTPIGPTPIPNGQTTTVSTPVAGRTIAIAIHPTNANTVYIGAASGGVWRSLDGGVSWTPIFDTAQHMSIGALALAPSSPTTLYVGTGEPNNSCDSFTGIGLYRIDNADTTPTIVGPINPNFTYTLAGPNTVQTFPVFNGRTIAKILVHPTQPGTIFVGTHTGIIGMGCEPNLGNTIPPLGLRGLYRSTNADGALASITFEKLTVTTAGSFDTPGTGNRSVTDMVFDPVDPNTIVAWVFGAAAATEGGIYRSTNALAAAASVTFTQTFTTTLANTKGELAIYKVGANPSVVYAATGEDATGTTCGTTNRGAMRRSVDGGVTWPAAKLAGGGGFCHNQCTYDIAVNVLPGANAAAGDPSTDIVMLGGAANGTCSRVYQRSTNGGATFVNSDVGLHADSHALVIAPSAPATVFIGSDGGIFKSVDSGSTWVSRNTGTSMLTADGYNSVQFQGVAVHPMLANFSIGGTQDNGTHIVRHSSSTWVRAESGDGGYAAIDRNSTDEETNIGIYHTFQNVTNFMGYRYIDNTTQGAAGLWFSRGCISGVPANGINCTDVTMFYAPMVLGGPNGAATVGGNPRQFTYFGTDRLYRSADQGSTHALASAAPITAGQAISTIAVSPQDDNYRIIGMTDGAILGTTTAAVLTAAGNNLDAGNVIPTVYVSRVMFAPNNKDIVYVALGGYFGNTTTSHVWKTSNFGTGAPTWTAVNSGLPDVPVNTIAIDPANANYVYIGTDIGVYQSSDGGASWLPYGTGLPVVPVFELQIQPSSRILRAATHGRGMWDAGLGPSAAPANISGRVTTTGGAPLAGVTMNLSGARSAKTITDSSGTYRFSNIDTDNFYTVTPSLVNYHFGPENRSFSLLANMTDATFTASRDAVISGNAIDTADYFVRQHYLDFLGREPDEGGFNFWSDQITSCGSNAACIEQRKINVSAAYFLSIEFTKTGGLVDGLYRASYGRRPLYAEFMPDTQNIARDVVVGRAGWAQQLELNKEAFINDWVQRSAFRATYDGLANNAFVDTLIRNTAGGFNGDREVLINGLNSGAMTRAAVLRLVVENEGFISAKRNETFVMMEYFGYLRRDPDPSGYQFWLNKLNQFDGNFERAEMVKAFINSGEYRSRFQP